jgi:hypothetical protein
MQRVVNTDIMSTCRNRQLLQTAFTCESKKRTKAQESREIHSKSRLRCCDWAPLGGLAFYKRPKGTDSQGETAATEKWPGGGSLRRSSPLPQRRGDLTLQPSSDRRFCDAFEKFARRGIANATFLCCRETSQ